MKRMIRVIAVLLVAVVSLSFAGVYATNEEGGTVNNSGYGFSKDNGQYIVIRDADGRIVETHEMSRQLYVNGTQYTIPAGGTLTSHCYYASVDFTAGFYFVHSSYSGNATTRDRSVTITIRRGTTVHGTRQYLTPHTFSTNEEDNYYSPYYFAGIQAGCTGMIVSDTPSDGYHYYEAVYQNNSGSSMVISLLVSRD